MINLHVGSGKTGRKDSGISSVGSGLFSCLITIALNSNKIASGAVPSSLVFHYP
jgi:hypothetical protein